MQRNTARHLARLRSSEVNTPNLSRRKPSAQSSCKGACCQRVTYDSQSWEHLIRCIRFVFTRQEEEICGQLQGTGMSRSGPASARSWVSCKLKPNLSPSSECLPQTQLGLHILSLYNRLSNEEDQFLTCGN